MVLILKFMVAVLWYIVIGLSYYALLSKFDTEWLIWLMKYACERHNIKYEPISNVVAWATMCAFTIVWPLVFLYRVLTILTGRKKK